MRCSMTEITRQNLGVETQKDVFNAEIPPTNHTASVSADATHGTFKELFGDLFGGVFSRDNSLPNNQSAE